MKLRFHHDLSRDKTTSRHASAANQGVFYNVGVVRYLSDSFSDTNLEESQTDVQYGVSCRVKLDHSVTLGGPL